MNPVAVVPMPAPVAPVAPMLSVVPMVDLNPMHWLGDAAKEGVADGFTAMMMSLWSGALWLLQAVFGLLDQFTTPRLDDSGLSHLYAVSVEISATVALFLAFGQLGLAAIRRDGRPLAALASGLVQYGVVLTVWVGVCAALVLGCAGLTKTLLDQLLDVDSFSGYAAGSGWVDHVSGTVEAAVLGVCALFMLIPAALGYLVIMLAREAALLVLVATMPIAAAGALGETTRTWMWKSVRWFLAACLTAPLLALVLGLGIQIGQAALPQADRSSTELPTGSPIPEPRPSMMEGAATDSDAARDPAEPMTAAEDVPDTASNVGLAVVGCVIMLVGCFCPMALFRLLAFVDPGTGSGAAFRSTMAANGGVVGMLSPRGGRESEAPTSAQQADDHGHSAGESSAEAQTTSRFSGRVARSVPAVGRAAAGAVSAMGGVAAHGASVGVDVMGQAGVGHQGYYDTTPQRGRRPVRTETGHSGHSGHSGHPGGDSSSLEDDEPTPLGSHDAGLPRPAGLTPDTAEAQAGGSAGVSAEDAVFLA